MLRVGVLSAALGFSVAGQALAPSAAASVPLARGEVITRAGDRLTGQIVGLDCHGLHVIFLGNKIVVALDRIAAASSTGDVVVQPGGANDKLTGRLVVNARIAYVTTRDLGTLSIPFADLTCPGEAKNAPAAAAPPTAGRELPDRAVGGSAASQGVGPRTLSEAQMAAVSGAGMTLADAAPASTAPAPAPDLDPAQSGNPPPAAATGGNPPAAQAAPATAQEQQEETERESLEFLRDEAVLVKPQKLEGDFGLNYFHTTQTLGNERIVGGTATLRYGVFDNLEAFVGLPVVWGQRQTNEFASTVSDELSGVGDTRFGLKYNLLKEGPGLPALVLGAAATAPTGKPPYLAPTGVTGVPVVLDTRDPLNIQIGTGHWQLTGSVTAFKSYDPLLLFTTINYTHFVPAAYYGVRIEPGDVWELNSGLGFGVNDTDTLSAAVIIDYEEKWKFNATAIPQTGVTPIYLKLAYIHILSPGDMIEPSLIIGATRDANDAVVAVDWIHRF